MGAGGRPNSRTWHLTSHSIALGPSLIPILLLSGTLMVWCPAHIHKCVAIGHALGLRIFSLLLFYRGQGLGLRKVHSSKEALQADEGDGQG